MAAPIVVGDVDERVTNVTRTCNINRWQVHSTSNNNDCFTNVIHGQQLGRSVSVNVRMPVGEKRSSAPIREVGNPQMTEDEMPPPLKRVAKECPRDGCNVVTMYVRKHVTKHHLPPCMDAVTVDAGELVLYVGALMSKLGVDSFEKLLGKVNDNRWVKYARDGNQFCDVDAQLMREAHNIVKTTL